MAKSEAHPALLGGHERVVAPDDAGDERDAAPGSGRDDPLRFRRQKCGNLISHVLASVLFC
jgi:hypothetical protein